MYVVELQVFTGRPNPRWAVSAGEARRVAELLSQLTEPSVPAGPRLGYQGLVVYARGSDRSWRPWVHVFGGTVTVWYGPRSRTYRDTVQLEGWLLDQADRAGFGDILDKTLPERRRHPR